MNIPIPPAEPVNQLRLDVKSPLLVGLQYGFQAKLRVPSLSPTASGNFFTIEFGFDTQMLATRVAAGVTSADPVRALINAKIDYRTNIFSSNSAPEPVFNNTLTFS